MSREEVELERIRAELQRIESERIKIELESSEIKKRITEKWYSGKLILQATVGGIIASALLAAWLVGYFQPILRKQQEVDSLETRRLAAELSLREQELKQEQGENKRVKEALTVERDRAKTELESLVARNRELQNAQKNTEELAVNLRASLEATQTQLAILNAQKVLSDQERDRLDAASRSASARAESLSTELQKLQGARAESANRSAQLSEQLKTRDIAGTRLWPIKLPMGRHE